MVGSNGTMIAIRLVRSKLRKREDHPSTTDHSETTVVQMTSLPLSGVAHPDGCCTQISATAISTDFGNNSTCGEHQVYAMTTATGTTTTAATTTTAITTTPSANPVEQFAWQFPPPYPPPHIPPAQYALYNDQDSLVHTADRSGFAKGFRKNIGGRWRRLVKRKPESETCAIPPELKDQLKTIYVY